MLRSLAQMQAQLEKLQVAVGRLEAAQRPRGTAFNDHELSVFSQWGEDGLIAHLVDTVPIERPWFVEFGVEDYREANTRFLLMTRDWRGLVMDGSEDHIRAIKADAISWRHELDARQAFVTRENINQLLRDAGFTGDIGLLSIDVDGNDYWIWDAIDVASPRIVVVEYNSLFGARRAVTVPYDAAFVRARKHYSLQFFGASIAAFARLGARKGYSLIGSNLAGNNLFFVRDDVRGALQPAPPEAAYRRAAFREARDERGELTFDDFDTRLRTIGKLSVYDLEREQEVLIESLRA